MDLVYLKSNPAKLQIISRSVDNPHFDNEDVHIGKNVFSVLTIERKLYETVVLSVSQVLYNLPGMDDTEISTQLAESSSILMKAALENSD